MPIPKHGWKPMSEAPQNGAVIIAVYDDWNVSSNKESMQPVWWMTDSQGKSFGWKKYGFMDTAAHCKGWMYPHELLLCIAEMSLPEFAEPKPLAAEDLDL